MEKKLIKDTKFKVGTDGNIYHPNGRKVKTFINAAGHKAVILNGKTYTVAYLVAEYFIPNPDECICVGYKDNDLTNASVDNLEWYFDGLYETVADMKEMENDEEEDKEDRSANFGVPQRIIEIDQNGDIINEWKTIMKCAKELDFKNHSSLRYYLSKRISYNDRVIMYEDDYDPDNAVEIYNQYKTNKKKESLTVNSILEVDIEGNIQRRFKNIKECARHFNLNVDTINRILRNTYKVKDTYIIFEKEYSKYSTSIILKRLNAPKTYAVIKTDLEDNFIEGYETISLAAKANELRPYQVRKKHTDDKGKFILQVLTKEERKKYLIDDYKKILD